MSQSVTPYSIKSFLLQGAMVLALVGTIALVHAQTPSPTFPDHDVAYVCNPTAGLGAPIQFRFSPMPGPHFDVVIGAIPSANDSTDPVIVSVTNSANVDITTGVVKLVTATAGLAMTINATDNVGVVYGRLEVDGKLATPFGNGVDVLPNPFYVRWNSGAIATGFHPMRLSVCDAAKRCAVRTWSMQK